MTMQRFNGFMSHYVESVSCYGVSFELSSRVALQFCQKFEHSKSVIKTGMSFEIKICVTYILIFVVAPALMSPPCLLLLCGRCVLFQFL